MVTTGATKCKRIIWRLQEWNKPHYALKDVRKAIMLEAGTDERTIRKYIKILVELGWLKRPYGKVYLIGRDYDD